MRQPSESGLQSGSIPDFTDNRTVVRPKGPRHPRIEGTRTDPCIGTRQLRDATLRQPPSLSSPKRLVFASPDERLNGVTV